MRENFTDEYTEGKLFIDGSYVCDTIEDKDRGLDIHMPEDEILKKKVYGKTAIPVGWYNVTIDWSNRFGKNLIHILNVPGFDGVRTHSGNSASDSSGCVCVGARNAPGWVSESRKHYAIIHEMVENAIKKGDKVYLTIEKAAR